MGTKMQQVETEIMNCWRVVDDVDVLLKFFGDDEFFTGMKPEHSDKIMNLMLGVKELYEVKFQSLWGAYEYGLGDYYSYETEALRSRDTIDSLNANIEALENNHDDTDVRLRRSWAKYEVLEALKTQYDTEDNGAYDK